MLAGNNSAAKSLRSYSCKLLKHLQNMGHGELQNHTASVSAQYTSHLGNPLEFHEGHASRMMGILGISGMRRIQGSVQRESLLYQCKE